MFTPMIKSEIVTMPVPWQSPTQVCAGAGNDSSATIASPPATDDIAFMKQPIPDAVRARESARQAPPWCEAGAV